MTWIKRFPLEQTVHVCSLPDIGDNGYLSSWRCDTCRTPWYISHVEQTAERIWRKIPDHADRVGA